MASEIPHITVLGSLNMDLVAYVSHHPLPGETLTADAFATSPGGKGANQAVACAKLSRDRPGSSSSPPSSSSHGGGGERSSPVCYAEFGGEGGPRRATARVSMVGCVGDDGHGAQLRGNLARHGVDVSRVETARGSGVKTGVAMIIVDRPTGENRIVLSPGANHAFSPADLAELDRLRTPDGRLPDLLVMQLEIPLDTVVAAVGAARRAGVDVLLNPAPAKPLPAEVYEGLAHLVVNETEAAILGEVDESVLDTEEGLERVSQGFVKRGVRNVIVTLGGRGVYFMSEDGRKGLVPAEKAKVVDTTAAGDTFVGRYALDAVAKKGGKFDIETAVRKANKAAAKTVERAGAQDSIPWRDELE
ncbi:putative ribokinase [Madurella mycetomatis]|uniref:Ribokinase n=1 Tax=Madurella mycetomatis TaxID=100816 RepID=A0A175WCX4_9PEZI|nr:putative ribokinase [Madurella mycetomatis]